MNMRRSLLTALLANLGVSSCACALEICPELTLSEQRVKNIVMGERKVHTDLPAVFTKFRTSFRKEGCSYRYTEIEIPESPSKAYIFILNRNAKIVDVQIGTALTSPLKCPNKNMTEAELGEIVKKERSTRKDISPPYPQYKVAIQRPRCLVQYFEYAIPLVPGKYQLFTIDPYGELLDYSVSEHY